MNEDASKAKVAAWLKRAAVHYLGQHSSSVENLRQVLSRKTARRLPDLDEDLIREAVEDAVSFCRANGFIDDTSYTETKVASSARKGMSRRRIGMMLGAKGVEREVVERSLAEFDDTGAAVRLAKRRRVGPWRKGEAQPTREVSILARAGFQSSLAFAVVRMSLDEAERILYGENEAT